MGYIAFINGKGIQVVLDDNGVHLEESVIKCVMAALARLSFYGLMR